MMIIQHVIIIMFFAIAMHLDVFYTKNADGIKFGIRLKLNLNRKG